MLQQFFSDLYDVSFKEFIVPRIVRIIFIIGLVLLAIGAVIVIIGAFSRSAGFGIFTLLILAPLGFFLYSLLMRIYLELVMVIFRIHEDLQRQTSILAGEQVPASGTVAERPADSAPPAV